MSFWLFGIYFFAWYGILILVVVLGKLLVRLGGHPK